MLRVAFRKLQKDDKLFYKGIDCITGRGGYHHCELIFSDGMSFSSKTFEGKLQVRKIKIDYDLEANLWDIIDLPDCLDEEVMRCFMDSQLGRGYDWLAFGFTFIIPLGKHSPNKWFCSEIIAEAMKFGGYLALAGLPSSGMSPNSLITIIKKNIVTPRFEGIKNRLHTRFINENNLSDL